MPATELNNYFQKIAELANKWKMSFNPHFKKQDQKIILSSRSNKTHHPPVNLNKDTIKAVPIQKHSRFYLWKHNFNHYLRKKIGKTTKGIGALRKTK